MSNQLTDQDLNIDTTNLVAQWNEQPRLFRQWADKWAVARKAAAEAKKNRELVKARLTLDAVKDPAKYGMEKTTKDCVEAMVVASKRYQEAYQAEIEADYQVDKLKGYLDAIRDRKKGLEETVFLFSLDYFAAPQVPKGADAKTIQKNMRKYQREKQARRMNRHDEEDD